MGKVKIGIVAPASRIQPDIVERATALAARLYGDRVELVFHPNSFLVSGHFAGDDAARTTAFLDIANDTTIDALWIARAGYGSGRIAEAVLAGLKRPARRKQYLGYSDAGFLLAGLYRKGYRVAHGPVVQDIHRAGGEAAAARALRFLVEGSADTLEAAASSGAPMAAFNITILSMLIGTRLLPNLADHVLMLEEVSEHLYAVDRAFCHITSNREIRKVAGIRLGRVSAVPENDPPFGQSEEGIARHWCAVSGIPYLGRADIGHDADNKIVPFGVWSIPPPRSAAEWRGRSGATGEDPSA